MLSSCAPVLTRPAAWNSNAGVDAEHAVEGVPGRQHQAAGSHVHRGEAVRDPAARVHQGQRLPRQQRRRAGLRLPHHRELPRRRLRRHPRRLRHRHRQGKCPLSSSVLPQPSADCSCDFICFLGLNGLVAVADRPAVQRGERAAGEELVQRHRQPGHRLRLRRRARRHPRRDAFPAMTRMYDSVLVPVPGPPAARLHLCCSFEFFVLS